MIVRLTDKQYTSILTLLPGWELDIVAQAKCTNEADTKADFDLPYIAWASIHKRLYAETYLRRWHAGAPVRMQNAVRSITREMGAWERHPALRNKAMLFRQPHVLPVWPAPRHCAWGSTWSWITDWVPFPVAGEHQMLLEPEFFRHLDQPMTRWSVRDHLPADDDRFSSDEALEPYAELAASLIIPLPIVAV